MEPEFLIWAADPEERYCALTYLVGIENSLDIHRGKPHTNSFPADAHFVMDPSFPKQIALSDSLYNLDRMVVVSQRVKDFIESLKLPQIEFLRVSIINHKKRVASPDYYVLHPTWVIDCIDQKKSELDWNLIDPELISNCNKLVLDPAKVPADAKVFRLKHMGYAVLIRADVAEKIMEQEFTGVALRTFEDFVG